MHGMANSNEAREESLKERFLFALFPCGLLSFIYCLFGPTELVFTNKKDMAVSILQTTPYFLIVFVVVALGLALAVALCKGSVFETVTKLILALSVASWLQASFFDKGFDYLDGQLILWHEHATQATRNLLLWVMVFAAVFILATLLKAYWRKVVCGLCVLLLVMQTAGFVSLYVMESNKISAWDANYDYTFSLDPQYDVSKNENVIVFVLDACSNNAINEMTAQYKDALADFSDFTYFENCAPTYYGTFPEVVVMLTGSDRYDFAASCTDFEKQAWSSETCVQFYELLGKAGYKRNVFNAENYVSCGYALIRDKIDNALPKTGRDSLKINVKELYKSIGKLTLFRYLPVAMKACYWSSDSDYSAIVASPRNKWTCNGFDWYDGMKRNGLQVVDDNQFAVYHFLGAHAPYRMDETGADVGMHDDRAKSLRGSFAMISDYLGRLKEIGAYQSSTVIVMADHGDFRYTGSTASSSAVFMIKRRNESHPEMVVSGAPITHRELLPTIAAEIAPPPQGRRLPRTSEQRFSI